jgi:predicted N-formylglutamate amidohydrolase
VGHLDSRAFKNLGLAAEDSDDHILWDPTTGILSFDVDGAGGAAAVRFAVVPSAVALTSLEFIVT